MRMFSWQIVGTEQPLIGPDQRLSWARTGVMGLQHLIAMFGSTVLAPILMGFDPNVAVLMSGFGTLLFFLITAGRVPSYLGSSFAFIGVVIAATGYSGAGLNAHIAAALGGIIACGILYALIGVCVHCFGAAWIDLLMPPVVTGAVVSAIGLNLAQVPIKNMVTNDFDVWMEVLTFVLVAIIAVFLRGIWQRLMIVFGVIGAGAAYYLAANVFGLSRVIDFSALSTAAWFGLPSFTHPSFDAHAITLIAPVAIILIAENLGHLKAVSAMTGQDMSRYTGRAFLADGLATVISGSAGGTGVTTYAENIGVMAATRIYSTAIFLVTSVLAITLGFCPKFGALLNLIPLPVMGGVSIVIFGIIAVAGARIWIDQRVDFSDNRNLLIAGIALILGTGDFTVKLAGFSLSGIGTATFSAIALHLLFRRCRLGDTYK